MPTRTQQDPSLLDAVVLIQTTSGTTQQTLTITPPAGQFVYLVGLDIVSSAAVAPAASAITTTSTNLGGAKWYGAVAASGGTVDKTSLYPSRPIKSAASGTAVTIVSNAAITNVTFSLTAYYYFAP